MNDKLNDYRNRQEGEGQRKTLSRYTFDPEEVMGSLKRAIFGQEEVLERLEGMLNLVHADISEPDRPLYVAMFLGPTGVGKTETIRILSEAIYGEKDRFCRIDMNTLTQEHYAAAITGAPPGYVGSKEGHTLFDEEKIAGSFSKPGIVLFDEMEKADDGVIQTLLNIFDNGKLVVSSGGRTIDFRNSLIFMTSNLGSRQVSDFFSKEKKSPWKRLKQQLKPGIREEELESLIQTELEKKYTPEFLNRIDDICIFKDLQGDIGLSIIDKQISGLNGRLRKHGIQIELDESAKTYLIEKGFSRQYGARSVKRAIRQFIEIPVARLLQDSEGIGCLQVTAEKEGLVWAKGLDRELQAN
nr:AAA family ATPase [Bacillus massiliglaciei]